MLCEEAANFDLIKPGLECTIITIEASMLLFFTTMWLITSTLLLYWKVGGLLRALRFPPPIKLTVTI
jgi:hypothetical protein